MANLIKSNSISFINTIEDMNLNDFTNLLRTHNEAIIIMCKKDVRIRQAIARKLRTLSDHVGLAPYYLAMVA